MAQTFSANFTGIAFAANKNMAALLNTSATELIKIRRITILNNQTVTLTGVTCLMDLRFYTAATLTAPTAVIPVSYDSTNTAAAALTVGTAGTVGGTANSLRRVLWSSDEATASAATIDELECLIPLNTIYEWQPHTDVQPITLRQNQMLSLFNISGAAGLLDIIIEYTKE